MRVLYVARNFPTISETFVSNEVLGQLERGHDVRVVSLRRSGERADTGSDARDLVSRTIDVGPLPALRCWRRPWPAAAPDGRRTRRWFAIAAAADVAGRLGGFAPEVVHAHFLNLPTVVAGTIAKLLGVPYTFTGHADDFMVGVPDQVLRRRVLHADAGFVVSEAGRAEIVDRARLDRAESRRLTVVRASVRRRAVRADRQPGAALTVVTVARCVPIKGLDVSIRAFALVRRAHPHARYWVVGDGPERSRLEQLVRALDLTGSVTLLGSMANREAQQLVAGADVAVLACRRDQRAASDGVPVFLMEAGLLGVPVVSTDVAGVPELVRHEQSGLLARPDDIAGVAHAILRVAGDGDLRARLATGLREQVETEFAPGLQLSRMHAVWRHLTTDRPPVGS